MLVITASLADGPGEAYQNWSELSFVDHFGLNFK
jgi:hypothetical protein